MPHPTRSHSEPHFVPFLLGPAPWPTAFTLCSALSASVYRLSPVDGPQAHGPVCGPSLSLPSFPSHSPPSHPIVTTSYHLRTLSYFVKSPDFCPRPGSGPCRVTGSLIFPAAARPSAHLSERSSRNTDLKAPPSCLKPPLPRQSSLGQVV